MFALRVGLEGTGTIGDLLLAVLLLIGIPLAVVLLGKLTETYLLEIWK